MAKKKILLLSDDLRMSSGVGTMSKEFVIGTIHHYDWVQAGGAIKHPEKGKIVDMNKTIAEETGVKDANLRIYPIDGYGSQDLIRDLLAREQPDAIQHYSDPRFWGYLYDMQHEIRQTITIFYYNIWDDWPAPHYNQFFYESCDLIMNISKQTVSIVKEVSKKKPRTDWDCTYLPHGVSDKYYKPLPSDDKLVNEMKRQLTDNEVEFVVFYNNRNIRRKNPGDVILAFKTFCDMLPKEEAKKCCLLMHTQPRDTNGTDLPVVANVLAPDYKVYFSDRKLEPKHLNAMYNLADVTINMASNEGFGLGTCESLMAGTPIIVNVTGGLQDQCGFKIDGKFVTYKEYDEIKSFHDDRKWKDNSSLTWGDWGKPIWPSNRSLAGSIPTPYIFDDRCRFDDAGQAIKDWYDEGKEKRKEYGMKGHDFVMSEQSMMSGTAMSNNFIKQMDNAFDKWESRKRFSIFKA